VHESAVGVGTHHIDIGSAGEIERIARTGGTLLPASPEIPNWGFIQSTKCVSIDSLVHSSQELFGPSTVQAKELPGRPARTARVTVVPGAQWRLRAEVLKLIRSWQDSPLDPRTNGILVLVPSALFLASKARASEFDTAFYAV
jgi:hypothetical protein